MTNRDQNTDFAEEAASLWRITLGPLVWVFHFILCYAMSAVWCAKLAKSGTDPLRFGIGALTVIALAVIAWLAWRSWVQWDFLDDLNHDHAQGIAEDRHEFLGHAAFLLAVLSAVGVIYGAMPALFIATCQ